MIPTSMSSLRMTRLVALRLASSKPWPWLTRTARLTGAARVPGVGRVTGVGRLAGAGRPGVRLGHEKECSRTGTNHSVLIVLEQKISFQLSESHETGETTGESDVISIRDQEREPRGRRRG